MVKGIRVPVFVETEKDYYANACPFCAGKKYLPLKLV